MSAGRKRAFDRQQALDQAMHVFWANGFAGTSLSDLTAALGINKPSLYAAFGNKEQLFNAAVAHYMSDYGLPKLRGRLESANEPLQERIRAYLYGVVDLVTDSGSPRGCLFVRSACEAGGTAVPQDVSATIRRMGQESEAALVDMLKVEQRRGNLSEDVCADDTARFIMSIIYGLAVLAKNGDSKISLRAVADVAVDAVPVPG